MNTATAAISFGRSPLRSLARAEYLQFRRNKTLVVMGAAFPVVLPLILYFVGRASDEGTTANGVANTLDLYLIYALVFVLFYPMLSMVTTRRGEGVLKRLRTGEVADWQILAAPAVTGTGLIALSASAVGGVIYATGAPAPVNPAALAVALVAGVPVTALLALATSAITRNAEAAQITSLPVMTLAFAALGINREAMPDRIASIVDRTPFAAVSDLMHLGTEGLVARAPEGAVAGNLADTFTEMGRPLATLGAWTVLAIVIARKYFRWDERG